MDNNEADWAFTAQGIAYNTGQQNRRSYQVLQIRNVQGSQFCIQNLAELDTTVKLTGFSDEELEPTDRIEKLALVVGEYLLRPASDMLSSREKKKPIAPNLETFDYSVHRCLGTKDTALIVAKIDARQLNLYQLTNKVDGLCDIQQLGRNSKSDLRNSMVWYREFVNTPRIEKASDQYESIRSKVRAYITTFIEGQETRQTSDLPTQEPSINLEDELQDKIMLALSLYTQTGSVDTLEQIAETTRESLGLFPESRDPSTEMNLQCIRLLGTGNMTKRTASKFIKAYKTNNGKTLWPNAVTSSTENIITPNAIMRLDAGLSKGALSSVISTPLTIPDAFYRTFIVLFCEKFFEFDANNDPGILADTIARAYELTEACMGSPFPMVHSVKPFRKDFGIGILSDMILINDTGADFLRGQRRELLRDFDINLNLERMRPGDIPPFLKMLSESADSQVISTGFQRAWNTIITRALDPIRRTLNVFEERGQMLKNMLIDLTGNRDSDVQNTYSEGNTPTENEGSEAGLGMEIDSPDYFNRSDSVGMEYDDTDMEIEQ
ncbi:hypothetical protein ACHAQC_007053 [Fusarium culmorum]